MVVQLSKSIFVQDQAMRISANRPDFSVVSTGSMSGPSRVVEERLQRNPIDKTGQWYASQFAQRGKQIQRFHQRVGHSSRMLHARRRDNQRRVQRLLEQRMLPPHGMLT